MRARSSACNKTYRLQTTLLLACARNKRAVRVPLRLFRARTADRVPEQGELREKPVRAPIRACRRPFPRRGRFPAAECSDRVLDAGRAAGGDRRVSDRDLALAVPDAQAEDARRLPRAEESTTRSTSVGPRSLASQGAHGRAPGRAPAAPRRLALHPPLRAQSHAGLAHADRQRLLRRAADGHRLPARVRRRAPAPQGHGGPLDAGRADVGRRARAQKRPRLLSRGRTRLATAA